MTANLAKALRIACALLAATGLLFIVVPFFDAERHQYDRFVETAIGVVAWFFATVSYSLSLCKATRQPGTHRVMAGVLWLAAVLLGAAAVWFTYSYIDAYFLPFHLGKA